MVSFFCKRRLHSIGACFGSKRGFHLGGRYEGLCFRQKELLFAKTSKKGSALGAVFLVKDGFNLGDGGQKGLPFEGRYEGLRFGGGGLPMILPLSVNCRRVDRRLARRGPKSHQTKEGELNIYTWCF